MQSQIQPTQYEQGQQQQRSGQAVQGGQMGMAGQPMQGSQMGTTGGQPMQGGQMGTASSQPMQGSQQMGGASMQPMQGGQQMQPGQQMQAGQQMGLRLQDVETPEQQAAIDYITWATQVCEWCADQCIQLGDPNMTECIQLCEDVSELGEVALTLIPRQSRFAEQQLQLFQQALQACAQECGRHQHAHCQECTQVLGQASDAIKQYLSSTGQQSQGMSPFQ